MLIRPMSQSQKLTTNTIIGGAIGAFIATLLGVPLSVLLLLGAIAAAYSFRWRVLIVRKHPEDAPTRQ